MFVPPHFGESVLCKKKKIFRECDKGECPSPFDFFFFFNKKINIGGYCLLVVIVKSYISIAFRVINHLIILK
jgi:hypothetical protein